MEKVKAKCIIVHISIIKGHPLTLRKTNTAALTDGLTTMITLFSQPRIEGCDVFYKDYTPDGVFGANDSTKFK